MELLSGSIEGKSVYKFMDASFVAPYAPSRKAGAYFIVATIMYLGFVGTVLYLLVDEREAQKSLLISQSIDSRLPQTNFTNLTQVRTFVFQTLPMALVFNSTLFDVGPRNQVLQENIMLGSVLVQQLRHSRRCDATVRTMVPASWCPPVNETDPGWNPPFLGKRTNYTFPWNTPDVELACPGVFACSNTVSGVVPGEHYVYGGYTVAIRDLQTYVNGTAVDNDDDLQQDFIDDQTRFLRVSAALFNPQYSIFLFALYTIETSSAGRIYVTKKHYFFPWTEVPDTRVAAEYCMWAYCILWILLSAVDIIRQIRRRRTCALCIMKRGSLLIAPCWRCGTAVVMSTEPTNKCKSCLAKVPPLFHRCHRQSIKNPWQWIILGCSIFIIITRALTIVCRQTVQRVLQEWRLSHLGFSGQLSTPFLEPALKTLDSASDVASITVILVLIQLYRRLSIVKWSSTFVQVFTNGGGIIAAYLGTFAAIFIGFAIAFHIIIAEYSEQFSTLPPTFSTSFNLFIGFVIWPDVDSSDQRSWLGDVVYIIFFWVVKLVGLSFLICLVTSVYKAARATPHFSLEYESLKILLAPFDTFRMQLLRRQSVVEQASDGSGEGNSPGPGELKRQSSQANLLAAGRASAEGGAGSAGANKQANPGSGSAAAGGFPVKSDSFAGNPSLLSGEAAEVVAAVEGRGWEELATKKQTEQHYALLQTQLDDMSQAVSKVSDLYRRLYFSSSSQLEAQVQAVDLLNRFIHVCGPPLPPIPQGNGTKQGVRGSASVYRSPQPEASGSSLMESSGSDLSSESDSSDQSVPAGARHRRKVKRPVVRMIPKGDL